MKSALTFVYSGGRKAKLNETSAGDFFYGFKELKNKGLNDLTEDSVADLIGYLILYKVQVRKEENKIKEKLIKQKDEKKSI